MRNKLPLSALISLCLSHPACYGYDPGVYVNENAKPILELEFKCDMNLTCDGSDDIMFPGLLAPDERLWQRFTREQVREFLRTQPHKNIIFVGFWEHGWPWEYKPPKARQADTLIEFFHSVGYKRVVLKHGRANGIEIIRDSTQE